MSRTLKLVACAALLFTGTACDKLVDSSHAAADVTGKAYQDARGFWTDAFTYHQPTQPQLPQTRYCYKNMDDVVCYDSVQANLTSPMVGYQDANNMSWIQQGGGSLGASGGQAIAYHPNGGPVNTTEIIDVKTPIEHDPGPVSTHRTGEIVQIDLPPRGL